ncbi:MAG TPA: hypothetical protein VI685_20260 [Candidatus Angelobacter sp.]
MEKPESGAENVNDGAESRFESVTSDPVGKVLVVGSGDIALKQRATYHHWMSEGVAVHCADTDVSRLEDCLEGVHRHDVSDPDEFNRMVKSGPFDLLLVNTRPELRLATALQYSAFAKQIVISAPQDSNYPLIKTISTLPAFDDLRRRIRIHDYYRNKDVFPGIISILPMLHRDYGQFRRMMLFLVENRSINDDLLRARSLNSGVLQDLAAHMVSLLLELSATDTEWPSGPNDDRVHRRESVEIDVVACSASVEINSILRDDVETFAAIDLRVKERISFPAYTKHAQLRERAFDVVVVVGKGLGIEFGIQDDLKAISIEFERGNTVVDLNSLATIGLPSYLPIGPQINRHHGGINRPLMLLSSNPPQHARWGFGGEKYRQWQTLALSTQAASIINIASQMKGSRLMGAYRFGEGLGDFIRRLAIENQIRPIWAALPSLTQYLVKLPRPQEYYD